MSGTEQASEHLMPVVVPMSPSAEQVVELLQAGTPLKKATNAAEAIDLIRQTIAESTTPALPGLLIVAGVDASNDVAEFVAELRRASLEVRPRVWPAFIDGELSALQSFDEAIDQLGPSACDLVLTLSGAPDAQAQADALAAWLAVKMPAPASVLGELPDTAGRICRYVALGVQRVDAAVIDLTEPTTVTDSLPQLDDVIAVTSRAVTEQIDEWLAASTKAASALANAAAAGAPAAVLSADATLTAELEGFRAHVDATLETLVNAEAVHALVGAHVAATDSETDESEAAVPESGSRVEAVSQLVLLASKGGFSRMFAKSKITEAGAAVTAAARADVARERAAAIERSEPLVREQAAKELDARADQLTALVEQERRDEQTRQASKSATALKKALKNATAWPSVDVANVQRAWGAGAPEPRLYVIGQAAGLEDDPTVTVIDVREKPDSGQLVLIAQYGLPVTALR